MFRTIVCAGFLLVALSAFGQDQPKQPVQAGISPKEQQQDDSQGCDRHKCSYDMDSRKVSGDVVRGPRTIRANHLNVLRYDFQWNNTVSFGTAPDLWSKLTAITTSSSSNPPAPPAAPVTTKTAGAITIAPELQAPIDQAEKLIADTEARVKNVTDNQKPIQNNVDDLRTQQQAAARATAAVMNAGKALSDFVGASNGTSTLLIPGINDQLADTDVESIPKPSHDSLFMTGIKASWSDADRVKNIRDSSQTLSNQLDGLKTVFSTYVLQQTAALESSKSSLIAIATRLGQESTNAADARKVDIQKELGVLSDEQDKLKVAETDLAYANQLLVGWEITTNSQTLSAVADLDVSGTKYTAFRSAQDALVTWKRKMETLLGNWNKFKNSAANAPDPFSLEIQTDCGFAFSRTKTNALTLTRIDRLPGSTTTPVPSETVLSVTVECTSPFTVSAGVAFSFIPDKEFGIQAVPTTLNGTTTTTTEIVSTSQSSFRPLPLGMIHARIWEPNDWFSVHASFGIAAEIRSQNSGGSDPGYLIGPSIALYRTMFFTPGVMIGSQVRLGSGFTEGETVPSSITTPPLQKSYKVGFGLGITFTKP